MGIRSTLFDLWNIEFLSYFSWKFAILRLRFFFRFPFVYNEKTFSSLNFILVRTFQMLSLFCILWIIAIEFSFHSSDFLIFDFKCHI
jgi:hypothetical protein